MPLCEIRYGCYTPFVGALRIERKFLGLIPLCLNAEHP